MVARTDRRVRRTCPQPFSCSRFLLIFVCTASPAGVNNLYLAREGSSNPETGGGQAGQDGRSGAAVAAAAVVAAADSPTTVRDASVTAAGVGAGAVARSLTRAQVAVRNSVWQRGMREAVTDVCEVAIGSERDSRWCASEQRWSSSSTTVTAAGAACMHRRTR